VIFVNNSIPTAPTKPEDPIRFVGGPDFYRYVKNDPIRFRDPSGKCESPSSSPSPLQQFCGFAGWAGTSVGVAGAAVNLTTTGSVLGGEVTTGILELGIDIGVGAIAASPVGLIIGGIGIALLAVDLGCKAAGD
jgi:hypothetical protein